MVPAGLHNGISVQGHDHVERRNVERWKGIGGYPSGLGYKGSQLQLRLQPAQIFLTLYIPTCRYTSWAYFDGDQDDKQAGPTKTDVKGSTKVSKEEAQGSGRSGGTATALALYRRYIERYLCQ